ncbi:MAG: RIP metalloprotease RseP [Saprospiraceae bacterium]|nr:RIP metalloprotease RseP [Saprospiraceae bacterium]
MDIVVMIAQFVLSLSILIILHEMGHFIPARLFKTRVEKFYLFFDPWFSLVKKKIGDTEYGIGWLPLGGYVKISGMVDESFDKEQMKQPPQPWEFRSKPAWQRLIIMLGGVTVNFILGFFIFGMLLWSYGEAYLPAENAKYGIMVDSLGREMGLQNGDKILKIGEQEFDRFNDRTLIRGIALDNARSITVERQGSVVEVPIDEKYVGELTASRNKNVSLFNTRLPFVAGKIADGSPAEKADFKAEDQLLAVNGEILEFFDQFQAKVKSMPSQEITVTLVRNKTDTLSKQVTTSELGTIGIFPMGPDYFFEMKRQDYTLAQALPAGVTKGWNFLADQIKAFGQMFKGNIKATESLGGFASITSLFPTTWDWETFWRITAILSLILGFMNLLPIPALDGGHVVFLLWEVVTGKKVSDKVMETATMIGFFLLIGLLLFANGLDVFRFFNK